MIDAGRVRAKPIVLTALAAMIGALFILDDPIFSGLAITLLFGLLASTLLTLLIIPLIYCRYLQRQQNRALASDTGSAQPSVPEDEQEGKADNAGEGDQTR